MVPKVGLEPTRHSHHPLKMACLPISPLRLNIIGVITNRCHPEHSEGSLYFYNDIVILHCALHDTVIIPLNSIFPILLLFQISLKMECCLAKREEQSYFVLQEGLVVPVAAIVLPPD